MVKKLLFDITDHNALDTNGDAPLHCFVKRKDKEKFNCLITFLIHSKCDVNLPNTDGQTALHLACQVSVPFNFSQLIDPALLPTCYSHDAIFILCDINPPSIVTIYH